MAKKITARQCKIARGMIQWNIYDLTNASGVIPKRIDDFERGLQHLLPYEYHEIIKAFHLEGLAFTDDFEVKFIGQRAPKKQKVTVQLQDQEQVVIDETHEVFDDLMRGGQDKGTPEEKDAKEKEKKEKEKKDEERREKEEKERTTDKMPSPATSSKNDKSL